MASSFAPAASALGNLPPDEVIFGSSSAMAELRRKLERLATAEVPLLIQGEIGTGKEVICRFIHSRSPWSGGPFVKVNCPAIPGTLLESELFGYEKGAFTGAYGNKPGRVESAQDGTLFLDEISELDGSLQAKLLQVLQDGQFFKLGAQKEAAIKARVICATNRDLEEEVQVGNFRADLFYRINVVKLSLPSLRERRGDIRALCAYFTNLFSEKFNAPAPALSASMLSVLEAYHWPGNIRELENLMKRYVILGSDEGMTAELLATTVGDEMGSEINVDEPVFLKKLTKQARRQMEQKIILKAMETNQWNRKKTARFLNISYRALLYKLKEAGVLSKRMNGNEPAAELGTDVPGPA